MYDACRCCILPKMRLCARTSNMEIAKTEEKNPEQEKRKVGQEDELRDR
jgi:hypothetical protein